MRLFKQKRLASVQAGGLGASALRDEMDRGAMSSVRRTVFLNTTAEFFWRWLEKYVCTTPDRHYIHMIPDLHFPTEDGRIIHLQRMHGPCGRSDVPPWSLCGLLAEPSETFEEAEARARSTGDNWLGDLISFDTVQLAPERLEVIAKYNPPAVMSYAVMTYFDGLLAAIEKRWPEAQMQVAIVASVPEKQRPGGAPGLNREELVYRLAKAQEAEEIKRKCPELTWKEIVHIIDWARGGTRESRIKLLEDARYRLGRLKKGDPEGLLDRVAEYRRRKEKKET